MTSPTFENILDKYAAGPFLDPTVRDIDKLVWTLKQRYTLNIHGDLRSRVTGDRETFDAIKARCWADAEAFNHDLRLYRIAMRQKQKKKEPKTDILKKPAGRPKVYADTSITPISTMGITAAIDLWYDSEQKTALDTLRTKFRNHGHPGAFKASSVLQPTHPFAEKGRLDWYKAEIPALVQFVEVLTGAAAKSVDVGVLAHMLWQVKRKIQAKPVKFEMLLNIFGAQGAGKTHSMRKLFAPFQEVYGEHSLHALLDTRASFVFGTTYINMFEELEGADRVDIGRLKAVITSEEVAARTLGTHKIQKNAQNCTFFSTSNRSIYSVLYDTTGMRRFWEIKSADRLDWDALAAVPFETIWTEINENADDPIYLTPVHALVDAAQGELKPMTSFQDWVQTFDVLAPAVGSEGTPVLAQALFDHYCQFCEAGNYKKTLSIQGFSQELRLAGVPRVKTRRGIRYVLDPGTAASEHFRRFIDVNANGQGSLALTTEGGN